MRQGVVSFGCKVWLSCLLGTKGRFFSLGADGSLLRKLNIYAVLVTHVVDLCWGALRDLSRRRGENGREGMVCVCISCLPMFNPDSPPPVSIPRVACLHFVELAPPSMGQITAPLKKALATQPV